MSWLGSVSIGGFSYRCQEEWPSSKYADSNVCRLVRTRVDFVVRACLSPKHSNWVSILNKEFDFWNVTIGDLCPLFIQRLLWKCWLLISTVCAIAAVSTFSPALPWDPIDDHFTRLSSNTPINNSQWSTSRASLSQQLLPRPLRLGMGFLGELYSIISHASHLNRQR